MPPSIGSVYEIRSEDAGHYIRVAVFYTDDFGTAEVAVTNVIGPVPAP